MNRNIYNNLKRELAEEGKDFDDLYVKELLIEQVIIEEGNQIRKNGPVVEKTTAMAEDISLNGQEVPIDVREMKSGNGKRLWEAMDGMTRINAHKKNGTSTVKVSVYHDEELKLTSDEWFEHRVLNNNHDIATSNTADDINSQLQTAKETGFLDRKVGFKYHTNPKRYVSELAQIVRRDLYPRMGMGEIAFQNVLKKVMEGEIKSRYENYNVEDAVKFYKQNNNVGWKGNKVGEINNDATVYKVAGALSVSPQIGNALFKLYSNPDTDVNIMAWQGDLTGYDDAKLFKARQRIYDECKKGMKHPYFKKALIRDVVFLPQIKTGRNAENLYRLYTPQELGLR